MPILEHDVKLLKAQTMDDVAEGGGAASGLELIDGQSNNLFPDISELDRVFGRVMLKKVFVAVETLDDDTYAGVHVIISRPPGDPRVFGAIFSTGDAFDLRSNAQNRIESYLARGANYAARLFGDHIAGQMVVQMIGQTATIPPVVGQTMMLENETAGRTQYVKIAAVSSEIRTFTDDQGDFKRLIVIAQITDRLEHDFAGFEATRMDPTSYVNKTRIRETVVADASRYYGIKPLLAAATLGSFGVQAESIYSPIVPSAQTETPIADARMNQQDATLVPNGGAVARTIIRVFTSATALYVGGGILPGSLSVSRSGITLSDVGGRLRNDATGDIVGNVDYANGVLTLATNVFPVSGGEFAIAYTPAATPVMVSQSIGRPVTVESRALSWVSSLEPAPARGSLSVSYRAGGRWYVLTDDGSGSLRGSDTAFGAGQVNFATGTVVVTFGALPDVGSEVILSWSQERAAAPDVSVPIDAAFSGSSRLPAGRFAYQILLPAKRPTTMSVTWTDSVGPQTATYSGGAFGGAVIQGSTNIGIATLTPEGLVVAFCPPRMISPETLVNLSGEFSFEPTTTTTSPSFTDDGLGYWVAPVGAFPIGTLALTVPTVNYPGVAGSAQRDSSQLYPNAAGDVCLYFEGAEVVVGSVGGGQIKIRKSFTASRTATKWVSYRANNGVGSGVYADGVETANVTVTVANPSGRFSSVFVAEAAPNEVFATSVAAGEPVLGLALSAGFSVADGARFTLGTVNVAGREGKLYRDIDSTTGVGVEIGVIGSDVLRLTAPPVGVSPTVTNFAARQQPPIVAKPDSPLLCDGVCFHTAVAPLRNGSVQIAGTWDDGTTFVATADSSGRFATATDAGARGLIGYVDYQTGVVKVRFCKQEPSAELTAAGVFDISGEFGGRGLTPATWRVRSQGVRSDSLRYNAAAYTYVPLDASILGLNPVRLPSDGRVPIFRPGSVAVVHHTDRTADQFVSNGDSISCGRVRLARVRVIGADGATIVNGYAVNLDTGVVNFSDVSGYSQPVHVEHRIEDAALVTDAQINGMLTFSRPLTHDYPAGSAYVSSALLIGDMKARAYGLFDQITWTNVWSDVRIGDAALPTYDTINHPIVVTNSGCVSERWLLRFTNPTTFDIIGEHLGVIGTGTTAAGASPLNPATGRPYFTIAAAGFGLGWATGNSIRFNTEAMAPIWVARIIQQGPATLDDDGFQILVRGDVDA